MNLVFFFQCLGVAEENTAWLEMKSDCKEEEDEAMASNLSP